MHSDYTERPYRGYVIGRDQTTEEVSIWSGTELIDTVASIEEAKKTIDEWVEGSVK